MRYLTCARFVRHILRRQRGDMRPMNRLTALTLVACVLAAFGCAAATDPGFAKWVEGLWPDAQKMGVSRKTFTSATHALEPDLTLPDLDIPGRKTQPPSQAEFVQTPADYVRESTIARLAEQGKR